VTVDLFGEQRVHIPDNSPLEREANHILELVARDSSLLNGTTMGQIDRKLLLAVWKDNGMMSAAQTGDWATLEAWAMDTKRCIDPEVVGRARRWLLEHDQIRVPSVAVADAERQRQRIGKSLHPRVVGTRARR